MDSLLETLPTTAFVLVTLGTECALFAIVYWRIEGVVHLLKGQ